MIFTPALAPIRVAPALIMLAASSNVRTPPEALTPICGPTVLRISSTSWTVAPPPANPVDVLTKSAPASFEIREAMVFSSSVNNVVSIMTLTIMPAWHVRRHDHAANIFCDRLQITCFQRANVDDHIDLGRALPDGSFCFEGFGFRGCCPQRKTDHCADF